MKTIGTRFRRSLAALALVGTFSAGITGATQAAGLASTAGARSSIVEPGQLSPPFAPPQANAAASTGMHDPRLVPDPTAPQPATVFTPIATPPPSFVLKQATITAPNVYGLQATASAVTVKWFDRSDNELGFKVFRRDTSGNWQVVYQVATSNMLGSNLLGNGSGSRPEGTDYTWVDTSTNLSGQCYMVAAYNDTATGYDYERCTVRPDPSRFPQAVGAAAPQWVGLSDTNDGTGRLYNTNIKQHVLYGVRTWGVNLTYGDSSLWRIEAQGGPHLMKGQAVAIKVWGGGWLTYGHQTYGVDLQMQDTPVYEWYVIGSGDDPSENTFAGSKISGPGTFALWNSDAQAYLVEGHQTFGISLKWYQVGSGSQPSPTPAPTRGVKTERVLNCSVDQHAVEVFLADLTAGGGYVDQGRVNPQYGPEGCPASGSVPLTLSPLSGHHYVLVATDSSLTACDGGDDPRDGACRKMTAQFVGDANGFTRTDIVDSNTQITP